MSILNFMSKKKGDLPPPPPPDSLDLPPLPELPDFPGEMPSPPQSEIKGDIPKIGVKLGEIPLPPTPEDINKMDLEDLDKQDIDSELIGPSQVEKMPVRPALEPIEMSSMPKFDTISPDVERLEFEEPTIRKSIPTKPIFVSMQDFQYVHDSSKSIKQKLDETEEIILKLNEMKNVEEREFDKWRRELEKIETQINHIDQTIAKAED